ncbi:MAG: serine hydrolase [Chloroflexi bacterium]|nr:serine hydrolase [Chloroflexota bacterium]
MTRRPATSPPRSRSLRGWLTLLVVILAAIVIGVGPAQLSEIASGVFFRRPAVVDIPPPPPSYPEVDLQSRLQPVASSLSRGELSMAAIDLQSGATASVDSEHVFPAASLFKLPILMAVLDQEDSGELDPNRMLEIEPDDWTDGSGVLQARVGDRLSVHDLTQLMIQDSDNIAALVLLDVVGTSGANAIAEQLGMPATHVVDHRAGEAGDHTTSAEDMAHLLFELATGEAVNQQVSEQALSLLEAKQSVSWLGDDLPFWVKVAHKWGDLPGVRHDAGVVFTPRGNFVLAVLTQDASPDEVAALIARASKVTYDYLGASH